MREYPKIDGITPRKLHEVTSQRNSLDSIFCEKALYRFGSNTFVIIKPYYANTSKKNIEESSVRWVVESGQSIECEDREDGPFDNVEKAVEFIQESLI